MVRRILATTLGIVALSLAALTPALTATPAGAAPTATRTTPVVSAIVGTLGYEGGAYPRGFHPTAGRVTVEFNNLPLVLLQRVGPSGHFQIPLPPGTYTVTGCGQGGLCGRPKTVIVRPDQVRQIRLIWAFVP